MSGILSNNIEKARTMRGYSQDQVARALGISQSTWALYESGNREPNFDALLKIADFFGVYTDYLLGNQKYKNIDEELLVVGNKGFVEGKLESEMPEIQLELTDIFISIIDTYNELNKAKFQSAEEFLPEIYKLMQSLYLYIEGLSKVKLDCDSGLLSKKEDYISIADKIESLTMHLKKTATKITDNIIDDVSNDLLLCLSKYFSIEQPDEDDLDKLRKLTDKLKGGIGNGNSKKET